MPRNSLIPFGFGGFEPVASLHREMNRLFDDAFRSGLGGTRSMPQEQSTGLPSLFNASMNVSETDQEYRVTVELPGVTEQDIELNISDDVLTISGEKKFESERGGKKESYHYVERSYGTFQRSLRLPFSVNPDEVKAAFQNGVLTITVPKSAQQQRSRKIQIQAASSQPTQTQAQEEGYGDQGGDGSQQQSAPGEQRSDLSGQGGGQTATH
ncbi:MAG: Hsp20/alpha crystallin family protein [Povalibacter sp.]